MATINVFEQYFEAEGTFNGVERKAASVLLVSESDAGHIKYDMVVNFFPHRDEEDFAISYDACFSKTLYEASGRRSRKREEALLSSLREGIDALAGESGGTVFWDRPLIEARRG